MMDCITSGIIWSKWTFCVFGWKRIKGWTVVERALNKITITWCYFDKKTFEEQKLWDFAFCRRHCSMEFLLIPQRKSQNLSLSLTTNHPFAQTDAIHLAERELFWRQWCSLPLNRSFRWNMFYMLHFCFCLISRSQLEFSDYCEVFSGYGRGWWDMEEIWKRMVRCTKDNLASYRGSKPCWKCNFTMTVLTQSSSGQNKKPWGRISHLLSWRIFGRSFWCSWNSPRSMLPPSPEGGRSASQLCNCMQDKSGLGRQVVSRKK